MIDPFANDHQSMQIGDLVIENQQDKIIIYGDIDLAFDDTGYQQAQQLNELTQKIIQAFADPERKKSIESKEKSDQPDKIIDNPFL